MTEKQLAWVADTVAQKVLKTLQAQQEQWDEEFQKQQDEFTPQLTLAQELEVVDYDIDIIKGSIAVAVAQEDYNKATIYQADLEKLQAKRKGLIKLFKE
jgi:hypothetical protein